MATGTILEVSSAKIGNYLACMRGFIYAWYIDPSYSYVCTTNYLASYGYDLLLHDYA